MLMSHQMRMPLGGTSFLGPQGGRDKVGNTINEINMLVGIKQNKK